MAVPFKLQWVFGLTIAALVIGVPIVRYRAVYDHARRLREVDPGILYRSGCLTADGFADAVKRYGIKTIVNLQDEFPDPEVRNSYFDLRTTPEIRNLPPARRSLCLSRSRLDPALEGWH